MGSKMVKVTNLFTREEKTYDDIEAFRIGMKETCDPSMARLIDMMGDAYAEGRSTDTYEWMLGMKLETVKD